MRSSAPSLRAAREFRSQRVAGERPVGHDQHARAALACEPAADRGRLAQRPAAVGIRRRDLPDQRAGDGAEQECDADERVQQGAEDGGGGDHHAAADHDVKRVGF